MQSKVFDLINQESKRQKSVIELIASENYVSENVMRAVGSCLTNKYSEGYPLIRSSGNKGRYYGGCKYIDELEEYCCNKWKEAFKTSYHVNVQPHSGSNANLAAYMSVLPIGAKILSLDLKNGGHLTHGAKVNISGKIFIFYHYGLTKDGYIDMNELECKAEYIKPDMIIAGGSAYSREIDFYKISKIAEKVGAYFMVDMAHIAGLILAGDHMSPFGLADIITTTTHKTLRGPRGGMIFCKENLSKKIDSAVFPGVQGGPLQHVIAGKAVAAEEACTNEYKEYIHQVVKNAKAMAEKFISLGNKVVTGGTDTHLFLLDLSDLNISGKEIQDILEFNNIIVNKNCIPNETRSPIETSGIRIGTPAMTTKGYKEKEFIELAIRINDLIYEYSKS